MRTLRNRAIAGAALALAMVAGAAEAQQRGSSGRPGGQTQAPRWGGKMQGRWWGGMRAPGGWGAYRRPARGYVLPSYWIAPSWAIVDWRGYGLPQPPAGYGWSRYYDDAVLIDTRGSVYDTISGIEWDRNDGPHADYAYDDRRPGAGYAMPGRADNGVGGAVIGGAAGALAGNVIAGRGNRLGGTLIGAGVGAAAGYAIDRAEDRDRRGGPPRDGYGADYDAPDYGSPGYDDRGPAPPRRIVVPHGSGRTVHTVTSDGGYYEGGYYYAPVTTTITVDSPPCEPVTTTEYVTERAAPVRRVYRSKTIRRAAPRTKALRR